MAQSPQVAEIKVNHLKSMSINDETKDSLSNINLIDKEIKDVS